MITFKNIAGNKFLAVGTIQRKSALNGEKSLTGTLYDGKDVLNKIDKGWSLEFDGEPYVVTYFERNDNNNSVSFDAIHKFFWDMTKKVLYSSTEISGSHTIKWYLDQIFANTGYTYALNFSPAAIEKDNWGNKTRLSLFNDLITSIAGEFEINGTLISIFQNIGTDLSTIVRYGFNLSDMTIENDATSFVTYGEGFGAYANQENQTGDRVHVTYTSPLASVYGVLQAEPVDDQRYTSQDNLQAAVKSKVDSSFSVSVQLSLYDLTAAGYPYKMANVGDWLTAVDENLDFKQRIRIISIDDEFSADGTRISYTVTAGDIGLTKKYQDANASMASQVANAIVSAGQASTDANFALIAANGKLTAYYVGSYDELPTTANEGDLGWVTSGDGRLLYIYTKKADGSYYWEKRIDPEMGDQIAAGVTEAVAQANAHTDEVKQGLSSDIATAKSQAASQASTAETNAKSAATSQFNQAQSALSAAKSDLTNSIASEASARNVAVAAANSQAQTYVNQAKSDINATINAIRVGGRNLILNSKLLSFSVGNNTATTSAKVAYDSATNMWHITSPKGGASNAGIYFAQANNVSNLITKDQQWAFSFDIKGSGVYSQFGIEASSPFNKLSGNVPSDWTRVSSTGIATGTNAIIIYFNSLDVALDVYIKLPKLEVGNKATDWTSAPEDVVLDYTTKDNEIKTTISQYQTTNDGKVSKAQTDATTALGQVATKVSQTDYDTKTGDLTTKYTQVKQTVDSQATDIVSIKETDGKQDARMTQIESDTSGVKTTVSNLQTAQGKQSGDISTLQQRADGFDATVTKVNNLSVGGRNLLINTSNTQSGYLVKFANTSVPSGTTQRITFPSVGETCITKSATGEMYYRFNVPTSGNMVNIVAGKSYTFSADIVGNVPYLALRYQTQSGGTSWTGDFKFDLGVTTTYKRVSITFTAPTNTTGFYLSLQAYSDSTLTNTTITDARYFSFKRVKFEEGTIATSYEYAPEDADSATAKAQLTADNAALTINNYKTDADGRISKAQADIITNANAITQKVSQTDYNTKTGDLDTRITKAQTTADGAVTTVGNYQTSNDKRVKAAESAISQNANDITLRATTSDLNSAKSDLNSSISQVKITADSISNFVRDSSGNISSDFQTALSKTSIITDSTLATSIQKQTATQISSAITDNNGKIISLINQDSSGVQIAGKNIVLNGDTTVTGAFKVSQANIANGAIGTAQIGDAAITNAKIADLDVSKITGNVTNFIQSYWNGVYGSTTMNSNGLSVQSGSMTTLFDSSGAHFAQGTRTAQYSFGNWIDNTGTATSAVGLYMGLRGDNNSFLDIIGPSGAAVAVIAGSDMADGANTNNVRGAINLFADTNIRSKLLFKGNDTVTSTYIEANEIARTMNFYTDDAKDGNGNWFWFNHKVLSVGTFSSTSLLSKKNVIADYEEDALSEITKTDIVEFEYKNDVGEKHISPIIDDMNDEKDYYIPKTILSENSQYVDMYSMISMAWKAIKQLNEKIGEK